MNFARKISGLVLLFILLFGSIGISFYLHECDCKGTNLYSVNTGLSDPDAFCCCSMDTEVWSECALPVSVDGEKCCKETIYFYLIPFAPEKITSCIPKFFEKSLPSGFTGLIHDIPAKPQAEVLNRPHSPPEILSGKELLYFIQQIKIPFPVC